MPDGSNSMVKRSSVIAASYAAMAKGLSHIKLADLSFRGKFILWGNPSDASFLAVVKKELNLELPLISGGVSEAGPYKAIWANPKRWYVICEEADERALADALKQTNCVHMSVSDGQACFRIEGVAAIDVLKKGCSLDFSEQNFTAGQCLQTRLAITKAFMHRLGSNTFDIYVERSYAEFVWKWLVDAAQEYEA